MKGESEELIELDLTTINYEDIRDSTFNTVERIEEAKQLLNDYSDYRIQKIKAFFDDDEWIFKEIYTRSKIQFNFKEISNFNKFNVNKEGSTLTIALKCWIAKELNRYSLTVVQNKLMNLHSALVASSSFSNGNKLLIIIKKSSILKRNSEGVFEESLASDHQLYKFLKDLIGFLNFYNREKYLELTNQLIEQKNKVKTEKNYRKLPSFKDTLIIKECIDKWFEDSKKNNQDEMLKYYPLVLWWNLTSILPMRVIEFLHIKKNAFTQKDQSYYITFPRMKHWRVGIHRKEIKYDTLPVPKELYDLFQDYSNRVENFGDSEYLMSHKAYASYFGNNKKNIDTNKMFNYQDFQNVLFSFFKEILFSRYKININYINKSYRYTNQLKFERSSLISDDAKRSVESVINPGDLRHLAIINMMLQGYDKVEIQRLSGHFTEETQFSYFNHMENWMDIEIQKMEKELAKFKLSDESEVSIKHPAAHEILIIQKQKNYINKNSKKYNDLNYSKLDMGFCMDKEMACPSFNWRYRGCYFCESWFIPNEEIEEKENIISEDLNNFYEDTKSKMKFIQSIFKVQSNYSEEENYTTNQKLKSISKEIEMDIKGIAKLKSILGREDR